MTPSPEFVEHGPWRKVGQPMTGGTVATIAFSPNFAQDRFVVAGSALALHLSHDGGRTWRTPPTGYVSAPVTSIAFSPHFATDRTVFAAAWGQGLWRSNDGGETWENMANSGINTVVVSPDWQNDGTILLGTNEGILRSTNRAEKWDYANKGLKDVMTLHMALSPALAEDKTAFAVCADGLYRSHDGGETWYKAGGEALDGLSLVSVALSPDFAHDATLYVGTEDAGLLRSTDGGATWQRVGPAGQSGINAIVVQPTERGPRVLVATAEGSVLRTDDGGATWQTLTEGHPSLLALAGWDELLLAGAYNVGVLRSDDGGQTWAEANDGIEARDFATLAVSPNLLADGTLFKAGPEEGVFRSTDGGETWQHVGLETEGIGFLALSPDYANEPMVVAVGDRGLYRSTDGGETWQKLPAEGTFRYVAFSPPMEGTPWLVAASGARLLLSKDKGQSWLPMPVPWKEDFTVTTAIFSPNYPKDRTMLVVAGRLTKDDVFDAAGLWRALDEGRSWAREYFYRVTARWLTVAVPSDYDGATMYHRAYLGWGHRVMRPMLTQMKSWAAERMGGLETSVLALAFSPNFSQDRIMYVATNHGIVRSRSEGVSWRKWLDGMAEAPTLAVATVPDAQATMGHRVYTMTMGGSLWLRT